MNNNSRGILIFAHNNKKLDYIKIAYINAKLISKNLKVPVSLATDQNSLDSINYDIDSVFDNVFIIDQEDLNKKNIRNYRDTMFKSSKLQFYNISRYMAYKLSPYDETILLDGDYFIMSDSLNACWGSKHDLMINSESIEINSERKTIPRYISDLSIKMYWATVVYFKKSNEAEQLFSFIEHIAKNQKFYQERYLLPGSIFRNDFAFSIAIHMMNGYTERTNLIKNLPIPFLMKTFDNDDIYKVNGPNSITFYMDELEKGGNYILATVKDMDVHVMNKWAIFRHEKELLDL